MEGLALRVQFKAGETVEGYTVSSVDGVNDYTAENDNYIISFRTESGLGRNYSKINWYVDKSTNKKYTAMRFLTKFVQQVQLFSNALYVKYIDENHIK